MTKTTVRNMIFKEGSFIALLSFIFTIFSSTPSGEFILSFLAMMVVLGLIKGFHYALGMLVSFFIEEYNDLDD